MSHLCKRGSKKFDALARITPHINISERCIIMNVLLSQFGYCPLAWICHSRANHSKINRPHERCPRIIYSDKSSSFEALLEKDGFVSIHNRNFQRLAIEMYNTSKGLQSLHQL